MRKARTELLISNNKEGIKGIMFSPDFDTSQEMDVSKIIQWLDNGNYKACYNTIAIEGVDVPVLTIGNRADVDVKYLTTGINSYDYFYKSAKEHSLDTNYLINDNHRFNVCDITFDNKQSYLIQEDKQFFIFIESDLLVVVCNPFPIILKSEEILENKKYRKNAYVRLKGYPNIVKSYADNIKKRQKMYIEEVSCIFKSFADNTGENLVIGTANLFLSCGHVLLLGTLKDHKTCFEKDIFPYKVVDGKLIRYTDEEVSNLILEKQEFDQKSEIAKNRIIAIEELLAKNNLTYTVISKSKINFDKDGRWKTWMNSQKDDNANFGWFCEQDFLDWINCEGSIPFKRQNAIRLAKRLENFSNGALYFDSIKPVNTKISMFDDYDVNIIFKVENKKVVMTLDEVRKLIDSICPLNKITTTDIDKIVNKATRKNKIKTLFKKCLTV